MNPITPLQALDLDERFPGIGKYRPREQLIVVSDERGVYPGAGAWIMCLYALEDYRELSLHLARPALMPFARRVCELISHNRLTLSRALRLSKNDKLPEALPFRPPSRHRPVVKDPDAGCKL
jgi:hypothetical protein